MNAGFQHRLSLDELLQRTESAHVEFKSARNQFSKDADLPDYCAALANEGGGYLVLGVSNDREVVGTNAFLGTLDDVAADLFNKLRIRVEYEELVVEGKRVIIFTSPSRPLGQVVKSTGKYTRPMRSGSSLVEMDDHTYRRMLLEAEPDASAKVVVNCKADSLEPAAITEFHRRYEAKAGRAFTNGDSWQLLRDCHLLTSDNKITVAALLLCGTEAALTEHLPGSEVIFEWRQNHDAIPYDFRKSWRKALLLCLDEIEACFQDRNSRYPLQEGLFQYDIWSFDQKTIREALLNAVAHRDYHRSDASIFIKASPLAFSVKSPGGLPLGVTPENALDQSVWRNRLLAENLQRVGLIERSGQGLDDIFDRAIRSGKGSPSLIELDARWVELSVPASVKDINFVVFLERIANERQLRLSLPDIIELEHIRSTGKARKVDRKDKLVRDGLLEVHGRGPGTSYTLTHRFYAQTGTRGEYTRIVGLSRERIKAMILQHIQKNGRGTSKEMQRAFPELKPKDIGNMLQELRRAGLIRVGGRGREKFWQLAAETSSF